MSHQHKLFKKHSSATNAPADIATLPQRLQETSDFFDPKNLKKLILKYEGEVALLVIDVQALFCIPKTGLGNEETVTVSKNIGTLTPEFRKAKIPVYAVSYALPGMTPSDFYEYAPETGDTLIVKDQDSAFAGSDIGATLQQDKRKLLLVCGFNFNACVKETVLDARRAGYEVCILSDLVGNGVLTDDKVENIKTLQTMEQAGALLAPVQAVLSELQTKGFRQKMRRKVHNMLSSAFG